MSRKIKVLFNEYSSKAAILKEWSTGLDEGALAVGKKYIEKQEMPEHYGFRLSAHGRWYVNSIEGETVETIFRMKMFGVSLNKISQSLIEYQNPLPRGIKHWNPETIQEILKDEYFAGYKFIFQEEKVLVMQVGVSIIPKRIFALIQELNLKKEQLSQQEHLKRLGEMLLIDKEN